MVAYDPVNELSKLRDHLASADKMITLLFGAGTSTAVKDVHGAPLIPAVAALTEATRKEVAALGPQYEAAWASILDSLPDDKRTIEDVLTFVRQMRAAVSSSEKLHGLTGAEIVVFEDCIRRTISFQVRPDSARFPKELLHKSLARWAQRVNRRHALEIFTTNYDTLIERAFEASRVPVFDGFVGAFEPFFYPASLRYPDAAPSDSWVRLWKIHGSVTWTTRNSGDGIAVIRGLESADGEMILPSVLKYDESRKQPYVAMLDRLRDVLSKREDGVLVTAGYSFSDQHINEVILEAVAHNPRLHVFALCFTDPSKGSNLYEAARSHSNIVVFGPKQAVVGGVAGTWRVARFSDLQTRLAGLFIDDDKAATEADFNPDHGSMLIGDFAVLCALFDQVTGER